MQTHGRLRRWRLAAALATALAVPGGMSAVTELDLGRPGLARIEREIEGSETHVYPLTLEEGWYFSADVVQLGIDVVVDIFAPDGEHLSSFDSPTQGRGTERPLVLAESSGNHRLEVRSLYRSGVHGRYALSRRALRPGGPGDEHRHRYKRLELEVFGLLERGATASEARRALPLQERMLTHARAVGDRNAEAYTWGGIAGSYNLLGENLAQIEAMRKQMSLWRETGEWGLLSYTYQGLGEFYARLGESHRALDYFDLALAMSNETESPRWRATSLWGRGVLLGHLGQPEAALTDLEEALDLWRREKHLEKETAILVEMGRIHEAAGRPEEARRLYDEALPKSRGVEHYEWETWILFARARHEASRGRAKKARAFLEQALASWPHRHTTHGRRIRHRIDLGARIEELLGNEAVALAGYRKALDLAEDDNSALDLLERIATLEAAAGQPHLALAAIGEAIHRLESSRERLVSRHLWGSYLASHQRLYELRTEMLMRLAAEDETGRATAEALRASEDSRARSLREALTETRGRIRRGVPPKLLEDRRSLRGRLRAWDAADGHTGEMTDLLSTLAEVEARIRAHAFGAADLPEAVDVQVIQERLLDDETLLLEIALGKTRSFLWAVDREEISAHELPPRAEIEDLARRLHELFSAPNPRPHEPPDLYRRRVETARRELPVAAAGLSRRLLDPVAARLEGMKRLVFVADGALAYLPFGALPAPGGGGTPLLADHEIVLAPSASAIDFLRRRPATTRPSKTLAVVADPVFGADRKGGWLDGLFDRGSGLQEDGEIPWAPSLRRALRGVEAEELPPLPGTRAEAEAILALVPENARFAALGHAATRERVLSGELGGYRIVHFATHALLNSKYPELSGIVLSLVDEEGRPRDGFLRLHEIYDLELDAELVVLSACQTALGREVRGEGLLGLSHGFLSAGASAVVASLWSPDDTATAELMRRFYRTLLEDDLPPAAALRAARLDLARDPRFADPYFWAPFVLQGDWRVLESDQGADP